MSVLYNMLVPIYFLASLYVYKLEDDDDEYIRQYFSRDMLNAVFLFYNTVILTLKFYTNNNHKKKYS